MDEKKRYDMRVKVKEKNKQRLSDLHAKCRADTSFRSIGSIPIDVAIALQHEIFSRFAAVRGSDDWIFLGEMLQDFAMACRQFERENPSSEFPLEAAKAVFSKMGADARHKENRDCKADVFAWLDGNFQSCKSMDEAAEKLAGKVVPQKFRAVRAWVSDWKKLRAAGTA